VHLLELANPFPEVVKHANLRCMEDVGLREIAYNTGNVSKHVEYSVNMGGREFGIGCRGVGWAERSI
jgi:hypothetical protein